MKNLGYIAFVLFIMVLAVACSNGGIGGGPSIQYYAVTGHVLDADYQGLANVKVSAVYDGGMVEAVTELDGTFAFEDLHGEVEIQGPEVETNERCQRFER